MGTGSTIITIAHLAEALFFSEVPDDILVNILCRLDEDPRDLARLACVSTRFCKVIKTVCWKFRCEKILPLLVAELLPSPSPALHPCPEPPGGWASLQKLLVCCPGLWHAGVLLESWDFGLDRELGWFGDFGYPNGFSYSDRSVALERIFSEAGHSHVCESLDKKSDDRIARVGASSSTQFAVECSANGSATCMVFPNVNDVDAHVSRDVCELDSINPSTHWSEAGIKSDGNEGDMNCDKNEADVMDSDGIEVGMNDEGGMDSVKTEVGMDKCQCNKTGYKLGPKHCDQLEKSVDEECHVRDHEVQERVAVKQGAVQIYKSTCTQSQPTSLNGDPLNLLNSETGCKHQSKEHSDSAGTHVNQMHKASSEKRMQERRPKSHKRQKKCHYEHCHVTTGPWNLSREQGNKLLANRFRTDSLYICDWPGCLHPGDKRMYKLFRGVFKNFKHSHVWRNLKDMQAKATNVGCAFCVCKSTWDMVTTFCLKRSIEYHDDGEPVVRAYVCENGHVAGAWTDRPMYIL